MTFGECASCSCSSSPPPHAAYRWFPPTRLPCDAPGVGIVAFVHLVEGESGMVTRMMSQVHIVKNSSSSSGSSGSRISACGSSAAEAAAAVRAVLPPILHRPQPKILIASCDADADTHAANAASDQSFTIPAASALANASSIPAITFCPRRPGHARHASLAALAAAAAKAAADVNGAKYDAVVLDCAGGELAAAAAVFAWEMLRVDGVLLVVPRDDASVKVRV